MTTAPKILLMLAVSIGQAKAATFTWLGDLSGGTSYSLALAVSADGRVVVGYSGSANGEEAFRYEDGAMTGLGDLPGRMPYESRAVAVSADGAIVAGTSGSYGGIHRHQAFLWSAGVLSGLGYLPSYHSEPFSFAAALSDDGAVLAGRSTAPNGTTAAVYRNGAWEDLGAYPTFEGSDATAISPDGSVIGASEIHEVLSGQAFLVQGTVITPIGALWAGQPVAWPRDISAGGTVVVGGSVSENGNVEAFRYTAGIMTGLGYLPGYGFSSQAYGVSADGAVVVGSSEHLDLNGFHNDPFIWTEAQGMQRVADVLATQGAVGFDRFTNLEAATAVSADGLTIVGFGTRRIPGQRQAWRAVLDSPFAADTDADGVLDSGDNCVLVANPGQLDTDGDGFGNACDGDLNNSGLVTAADFAILRSVLNQSSSASLTAATADLNGSGVVTETDYAILRSLIGTAPGPSGLR